MSVRITCLVENSVRLGTRLWGEHGLSVLLETPEGRVLFDTGQSGVVLRHNLGEASISLRGINAIALSHGHYDHTGGLDAALKGTGHVPIFAHPDIFTPRFSLRPGGSLKPIGIPFDRNWLTGLGADWRLSREPQEVIPGVFTTGEVPRREPLEETGDKDMVIRSGDSIVRDPLLDDMSLVVDMPDGLLVLLGCCHAGVMNTLRHISETFRGKRVLAVMGGTHLAKASEDRLVATERALQDIPHIGLSHCTGVPVIARFMERFPEKAFVFQAGTVLEF